MEKNDGPKTSPAGSGRAAAGPETEIKPVDFIVTAKAHLAKGNRYDALHVMEQANHRFPFHPLILSYYGYLEAAADGKYRNGIETCKNAISLLGKKAMFAEDTIHAVLYLNLAKAYLAAEKKPDAIAALNSGMKYDRNNREIKKELMSLGVRKKPLLPFLDRSHILNKYLGMVFHRKAKGFAG
jgi:hypothetical protein